MNERNSRRHLLTLGILFVILALDLWTKYLIEANFSLHETKDIFGSFVQLILIYNQGGVFGIAQGKIHYFLIVSFFVLGFILYIYFTTPIYKALFRISIGMVLGGALGNMHDRILNRKGVVDFIYIGWDSYAELFGFRFLLRWPAFNIADSAILVGALLLAILLWQHEKRQKQSSD